MTETKTIKIDPRIFIEKPYIRCPKCKKDDSFGNLMVNETCFTKRCRECWYSQTYKLPPLNKKIIYLDQFVISNMMKSINDKIGKKQKVEKVYLELFEKLDRLVKLQIIICPDSSFHRDESLLSFYSAIKRMYEQLSHGVSFYDTSTIRRFQICEDFKHYLEDENKAYKTTIDVDSVTSGNLNRWQSKMLISVDIPIKQEVIEEFRTSRLVVHENFKRVFEFWQNEKTKTFPEFFKEIASEYGNGIVSKYINSIAQYFQASMGIKSLSNDEIMSFTNEESVLFSALLRNFKDNNNHIENLKKIIDYLKSARLEKNPINEIYSSLWGSIAYQASKGGRTSVPNIGMFNDINMVSTLLPFCDAIFVDKDMHSILNFGAVKKVISKYKAKIYSLNNIEDFFKLLNILEKSATKKHIDLVTKTYGDGWGTPFYEMYNN